MLLQRAWPHYSLIKKKMLHLISKWSAVLASTTAQTNKPKSPLSKLALLYTSKCLFSEKFLYIPCLKIIYVYDFSVLHYQKISYDYAVNSIPGKKL